MLVCHLWLFESFGVPCLPLRDGKILPNWKRVLETIWSVWILLLMWISDEKKNALTPDNFGRSSNVRLKIQNQVSKATTNFSQTHFEDLTETELNKSNNMQIEVRAADWKTERKPSRQTVGERRHQEMRTGSAGFPGLGFEPAATAHRAVSKRSN